MMPALSPAGPTPIARRLFVLAAPIIGLNVLNVLALAVDTAMCGRLDDSAVALEALGFAIQIVFLLMVAMMGLAVGSVALVARAHGARDYERVNHILAQSTTMTVGVGVGIAIVGNIAAPWLLWLLGARGPVIDAGLDYLRPLLTGTVFYYVTILYGSVLRGVGNTRLAFFVALVSNLLNVVFNYGLILGNFGLPALGVSGAAIGTVASKFVGAVVMIAVLARGTIPNIIPPRKPVRIDRPLARELFRVGAPAALDMVILNVAFMSIIGMLGRIEAGAVAAHGIGLRIQGLAFVPGLSVAQATSAMVGKALGSHNADEAKAIVRASIGLCVAIMSGLAIMLVFAAQPIVSIFDVPAGGRLEELSVVWMQVLGYGMPIVGVHIAFIGMLQGAGDTRTSLWINFLGTALIQIPLGLLLGFTLDMGALGVWLSFPISFAAKAAMLAVVYRRETWLKLGLHA